MPRKRFPFLLKHLAFDDAETRQERSQKDQFAAFQGFFEFPPSMSEDASN